MYIWFKVRECSTNEGGGERKHLNGRVDAISVIPFMVFMDRWVICWDREKGRKGDRKKK